MANFQELIEHGVHYGHQTSRWNPKMNPFIWGHKNGIHLIDVSKTALLLGHAAKFLEQIASEGKSILLVGTKKAAQKTIEEVGKKVGVPFVCNRWVGGTITNHGQVKKAVTRLLHLEDVLSKSESFPYTKKERGVIVKTVERLEKNIGGIRTLRWPIGAVVVVDVRKEATAVKEAVCAGIPVVALVDTNCDPSGISYIIPSNDDSPKAISFVVSELAKAIEAGKAKRAENAQQAEAAGNVEIEQVDVIAAVGGVEELEEAGKPTATARKPRAAVKRPEGAAAKPAARKPRAAAKPSSK